MSVYSYKTVYSTYITIKVWNGKGNNGCYNGGSDNDPRELP